VRRWILRVCFGARSEGYEREAERKKFGLELSAEKTRVIAFERGQSEQEGFLACSESFTVGTLLFLDVNDRATDTGMAQRSFSRTLPRIDAACRSAFPAALSCVLFDA
jgi:hypothetical protein